MGARREAFRARARRAAAVKTTKRARSAPRRSSVGSLASSSSWALLSRRFRGQRVTRALEHEARGVATHARVVRGARFSLHASRTPVGSFAFARRHDVDGVAHELG